MHVEQAKAKKQAVLKAEKEAMEVRRGASSAMRESQAVAVSRSCGARHCACRPI